MLHLSSSVLLVVCFLDRRSWRTLCRIARLCRRGFGACGLRSRVCGDGLLLLGLLIRHLLDVAVLVGLDGSKAFLLLGGPWFAVCFCEGFGGLAFFLCEFLGFDVVRGLYELISQLLWIFFFQEESLVV